MRDGSNKKLIIISILFMLCLLGFYGVVNYYANNTNNTVMLKPQTEDDINLGDQASLGDSTSYCEVWTTKYSYGSCTSTSFSGGNCRDTCPTSPNASSPSTCTRCNVSGYYGGGVAGTKITCQLHKTTKCTQCKEGYNIVDGSCVPSCSFSNVTVARDRAYVEEESLYTTKFNLVGNCAGAKVTATVSNGSPIAGTPTSYLSRAGVCNAPSVTNLVLKIGNTVVSTVSVSVGVLGKWMTKPTCQTSTDVCQTQGCAEKAGSISPGVYYTNWQNGCFTVMHFRGCTNVGGQSEKAACYGDNRLLSLAKSAKWIRPSQTDNTNHIKIEGVTSEKDCVIPKAKSYCEPKNIAAGKQEKNASVCEDNVSLNTKDGLTCDSNPFYSIVCDNTISTKFDNGDDGSLTTTTNEIYVGQGFKFGVTVTNKRKCTAKFNSANWLDAYNFNNKKINQINADLKRSPSASEKDTLTRDLNLYQNKQNKLKDLVKSYNNYNIVKAYGGDTALTVNYKVNKITTKVTSNFVSNVVKAGSGKYTSKSEVKLGISGVTNPYNYVWTNESDPRVIKLIPSKVYLNKNTGEVKTSGIDGGNKVYVDYYTDPGTYTMNIVVSSLGGNNTINNNMCKLKVKDQEIIYRPIDVSNPFINNKWIPGSNWTNDSFDFRNVIHSDIWKN